MMNTQCAAQWTQLMRAHRIARNAMNACARIAWRVKIAHLSKKDTNSSLATQLAAKGMCAFYFHDLHGSFICPFV